MERLTYKDQNGKIRINCWNEDCHGDDYTDGDFCPGEGKLCASLQNVIDQYYAYEALGTVEEFAALKQAESEGRVIPKETHQPSFVKYDAIDIFDQWNDTTGAFPKGTSWYYEAQGVIEEVAAMAFGAGAIYQSEAAAALAAMEGNGNEK